MLKKKMLSILVAFAMLGGMLAGCGNTGNQSGSGDEGNKSAETETPEKSKETEDQEEGTSEAGSQKKGQGYKIGFTDNYDGNTLHQQQEKYFEDLANEMKEDGIISEFYMTVANKDVATQVSQIQNFIMMGCDAIIIDPTSSSGLDGAIQEAKDAGVTVMIFNDGPVTSDQCYQLNVDCEYNFGYLTEWACEQLDYKGNVLLVRGIAGTSYDELAYKGAKDVLDQYEGMNVVGEVYGEWTSTVTQTEVTAILPTLPKVDLVVGQSGDAYGAAMAFESAGLDVPLITGGNRGEFLNWWMKAYEKNGYETISGVATPWFSAAALYLTVDILDGVEVPQFMYYPMDLITQDTLFDWEGISDSEVATTVHDLEWVRSELETQDEKENKPEMVK
ncbi:MAG: ABC transporter substrate-binding protein [Ruminococcus sp.]|nr:ABC transporter substrate-binding protein [Ruminococcus sp.]